jgi:hypothetical protein
MTKQGVVFRTFLLARRCATTRRPAPTAVRAATVTEGTTATMAPRMAIRTFSIGGDNNNHNDHNTPYVFLAQRMLGLREGETFTSLELRDAYFTSAKQCHPDLVSGSGDDEDIQRAATVAFFKISDAYELLRGHVVGFGGNGDGNGYSSDEIAASEEESFREACWQWLGVSPEIVEESKKCPMFRQWLLSAGKSHSAETWLNFFSLNGGFAPRLRPPLQIDGAGGGGDSRRKDGSGKIIIRRRRKSR